MPIRFIQFDLMRVLVSNEMVPNCVYCNVVSNVTCEHDGNIHSRRELQVPNTPHQGDVQQKEPLGREGYEV